MATLPVSRPSAKSVRVLGRGVSISPIQGTAAALLDIRVGDQRDFYQLERIASDFGDGFKLTKSVGGIDDERPVYHVLLSDEGHTCSCPGGIYSTPKTGRPCKHVSALIALRNAGKV